MYIRVVKQIQFYMKVTLIHNDALREVAAQVTINTKELTEKIETALVDEGVINLDSEDAGHTIDEIALFSGYEAAELFKIVFGAETKSHELLAFFGALTFMGDGDCPQCGGEVNTVLDGGHGHEWEDSECTVCDWANSTEPDWDIMPGGYSYDR